MRSDRGIAQKGLKGYTSQKQGKVISYPILSRNRLTCLDIAF
jgi:hypothetical protein